MKTRYNKDELWTKVKELAGITIVSLTKNKLHKISKVNNGNQTYVVEYASGNQELVSLDELYALYEELYRTKSLSSNYMKTNVSRILGWKHWHAPGSAMMAHIKLIDDHVLNDGATLYLKKNNESGLDYPIHKTPVWNKPTDSTDHQHLVESFTNTSLTEYFCNREKTRIALDSYLVFIAKKKAWNLTHKIEMYELAHEAFATTKANSTCFRKLYENLRRYWQVFRNSNEYWNSERIYNTLMESCGFCSIKEAITLANLHPNDLDKLLECILSLRQIKKLKYETTPIMAISKFLHFYNPKLFPVFDNMFIKNKVLALFQEEWNSFYAFPAQFLKRKGVDIEVQNYVKYIYWGNYFVNGNASNLMECTIASMKRRLEEENCNKYLHNYKEFYSTGFEYLLLGAYELERKDYNRGQPCYCTEAPTKP